MSFIVLPRRRKRPDRFELDYGHPLAQGLVFGLLNQADKGQLRVATQEVLGNPISAMSSLGVTGYTMDGATSAVVFNPPVSKMSQSPLTVSVNITPRNTSSTRTVFALYDPNVNLRYITLGSYRETGLNVFRFTTRFGTAGDRVARANSWVENKPTHLIGELIPSTSVKIYVDGIVSTETSVPQSGDLNVTNMSVGCGVPTSRTWFLGDVFDTLVYNRALSPTEIAILANKTDPMLAGLIKEKRTAPIYFLPSVNHWELQIKVDEGEWVSVPNTPSEITEYIKSTGLTSGTYYARIRKFTNGVPSDWEYADGVVYSAGGGGTPYEISYQFIFESGLKLSSTFSSESLISSTVSENCNSVVTSSSYNESGMQSLSSISSINENTPDTTNDCSSHIDSGFDSALNTSSTNETKLDSSSELSLYTELDFLIGSSVSNIFLIYHDNCADVSVAGTYSILQDFEIKLSELKQNIHSSDVATSSVKESYLDSSIVSSSVSESFINSESKIAEFNQTNYDGAVPLSTNVITSHPMSVILSSISISDVSSSINISEPYMISVVSEADIRYVEFIINDLQIIKLKTAKKQSAFLSTLKSNGSLVINKLSKR